MALKAFAALADKTLAEQYSYVAPDLTKARKPFIAALDKAKAQFEEGKQPRGANAMWSAANNVVKFTPTAGGAPVEIEGETVHYFPAERFLEVLAELRKEVEAGTLDDALSVDPAKNPGRAAAAHSGEVKQRAGWTPERRAKMAQAAAAKKAAKAK